MQHQLAKGQQLEYDVQTEQMLLSMGPQHPSTHGVLRLALRTDGEVVIGVVPHIGYLHRCAEKIGEKLTVRQFVPFTDRLDYLAAMNMNLGWALAVEKLLGIAVSEKTMHLRVLVCELDRIASHLVGTCALGLDLGSFTPFMWCFREREKILNLFEALCGARMLYNYIVPGGVMADLPRGWLQQCQQFLDQFQPVVDDLHTVLTKNDIFIRRTAGIGVLSPQAAISYGCTGPVLRATGVCWDLRRHGEPIYTRMYQDYRFHIAALAAGCYPPQANQPKVPRAAAPGDCWHRYYVRLLEIIESAALVRQAIDRYSGCAGAPSGPISLRTKLPKAAAYLETEAPKGQLGFLIVGDGSPVPWRVRIRSPSFCNLSALGEICRGCLLADVPAIVGSLDIVLGEIDR